MQARTYRDMQTSRTTIAARATFSFAALAAAVGLSSQIAGATPVVPVKQALAATQAAAPAAGGRVSAVFAAPGTAVAKAAGNVGRATANVVADAVKGAAKSVTAEAAVAALRPAGKPLLALGTESAVRPLIKFETVRWGGKPVQTLDEPSRILLAKAAAERARLHEVGLSYHDVYGVIEAETSWIPRMGSSKDGTPNLGIAQFEPRTARGLGLKDPHDPVQAVFAAALYMRDGARWASSRLTPLKLQPELHAAKVREGVSVYYNLSIKGRNKWTGLNTASLPIETQRHIRNASAGAREAAELAAKLRT